MSTFKCKIRNPVFLILGAVFLLCLLVWPLRLLGSVTYTSSSLDRGARADLLLSDGSEVRGTFQPLHDRLRSISFQFQTSGPVSAGTIALSIYDASGSLITESVLSNHEALNGRNSLFPLHVTLDSSRQYQYSLHGSGYNDTVDSSLRLFTAGALTASADTVSVSYNGYELKDQTPFITYTYSDHSDLRHAFIWYICFFVLGILLLLGMGRHPQSRFTGAAVGLLLYLILVSMLILADESALPLSISNSSLRLSAGETDNTGALSITPESGYNGVLATSQDYLLNPGDYRIGLAYQSTAQGDMLAIYDNGKQIAVYPMDPAKTYDEYPFHLEHSSLQSSWQIIYGGNGNLTVSRSYLIPGRRFYNDTRFLILLTSLLFAGIAFVSWRSRVCDKFNLLLINRRAAALGVLLIGGMASLPYLQTGLGWAIDLCYHLIRIEGIKDGLLSGQLPVILFPEAQYGNGYLNVMYPNLLLYLPALLRMTGVSMADSFKFLIFGMHLLTAALTWYAVKTMGGTEKAGFLAAALYTLSPYRFTNLYARGAIGEFLAMTFLPLIFAGLYHIFLGDRRKWPLLVLGMTGLMQTHVLSVLLAFLFCIVCGVLYLRNLLMEKRIFVLLYAILGSVLLNIGFLVPFLDFYQNGNLWMSALSLGSFAEYSLNLSGLLGIQLTGDYHVLTFGLPIALCAVIALVYLAVDRLPETGTGISNSSNNLNSSDNLISSDVSDNFVDLNTPNPATHKESARAGMDGFLAFLLILGIALTVMMLSYFPATEMMKLPVLGALIGKIQFAWRLLGPATLLFAMAGSIALFRSGFFQKYANILLILLLLLTVFDATRFKDEDFAYSDQIYTAGHASKVLGLPKGDNTTVYPFEWRPIGTLDSGLNTSPSVSDPQQAQVVTYHREGVTSTLSASANTEGTYAEIPVLYYMGYHAVDESGAAVELTAGANNRIRLMLPGDGIAHTYTISYRMPFLYRLAAWISALTAILFLIKYLHALWSRTRRGTK